MLRDSLRQLRESLTRWGTAETVSLVVIGAATATAAGFGPSILIESFGFRALVGGFLLSMVALIAGRMSLRSIDERRGDVLVLAARIDGGHRRRLWTDDDFARALSLGRSEYVNAHGLVVSLPSDVGSWSRFPQRIVGAIEFVRSATGLPGDLRGVVPLGSLTMWMATGMAIGRDGDDAGRLPLIVYDTGGAGALIEPGPFDVVASSRVPLVTAHGPADEGPKSEVAVAFDFTDTPRTEVVTTFLTEHAVAPTVFTYASQDRRRIDVAGGELLQVCDEVSAGLSDSLDQCTHLHVLVAAPVPLALSLGKVVGAALPRGRDLVAITFYEWQARSGPPGSGAYRAWSLQV